MGSDPTAGEDCLRRCAGATPGAIRRDLHAVIGPDRKPQDRFVRGRLVAVRRLGSLFRLIVSLRQQVFRLLRVTMHVKLIRNLSSV